MFATIALNMLTVLWAISVVNANISHRYDLCRTSIVNISQRFAQQSNISPSTSHRGLLLTPRASSTIKGPSMRTIKNESIGPSRWNLLWMLRSLSLVRIIPSKQEIAMINSLSSHIAQIMNRINQMIIPPTSMGESDQQIRLPLIHGRGRFDAVLTINRTT